MKNKTVIVTGGTRGIGFAIAKEFVKLNANVIVSYRGNEDAAKAAQKDLGKNVKILKSDVSQYEDAQELVRFAKEEFASVDVLVNNAGITNDNLIMRMSADDFDSVIRTNLNGTFNMIKAVTPLMLKQKSGRIINLSSIIGLRGNKGQANYAASKAGVIGLTMSAAKELGSRSITVNAIAPGFIETEMTDILEDSQKTEMKKMISLGRIGLPEEIAATAVFLASEGAAYITGQTIGVDGGMSI